MPDPTPIPAFWLWFQTHLPDFAALTDPDEPFWDVALAHLKKLDPTSGSSSPAQVTTRAS